MRLVLSILFLLFAFGGFSQNVEINAEPNINELIIEFVKSKQDKQEIKGYRVQIYSNSDYDEAKRIRFELMQTFPDQEVYIKYNQPNYRVRAGDFRTRLQAEKYKEMIEKIYNSCLIVQDKINFPKL